MKVILKTDVKNKGARFDIIEVPDGYAHNFLFANDLAIPCTKSNIKWLHNQKESLNSQLQKEKAAAEEMAMKIKAVVLNFELITHGQKVSNSVTNKMITDRLKSDYDLKIDKRKFIDHNPLNHSGKYIKKIKLHPAVVADLEIHIKGKTK